MESYLTHRIRVVTQDVIDTFGFLLGDYGDMTFTEYMENVFADAAEIQETIMGLQPPGPDSDRYRNETSEERRAELEETADKWRIVRLGEGVEWLFSIGVFDIDSDMKLDDMISKLRSAKDGSIRYPSVDPETFMGSHTFQLEDPVGYAREAYAKIDDEYRGKGMMDVVSEGNAALKRCSDEVKALSEGVQDLVAQGSSLSPDQRKSCLKSFKDIGEAQDACISPTESMANLLGFIRAVNELVESGFVDFPKNASIYDVMAAIEVRQGMSETADS